jgi:hypothetical protein
MENIMFNAKVIEKFLSDEECIYIINKTIEIDSWDKTNDEFWSNRVFNPRSLPGNDAFRKYMIEILNKKRVAISQQYNLPKLFNDGFAIVRWFPGMEQQPHSDDMKDFLGNDENNINRYREFGAIIYLNDNFIGGETYYPKNNFLVKPKVGTLAMHPGNSDHLHGVSKIKDNIRYTIATFWTTDEEHSNE